MAAVQEDVGTGPVNGLAGSKKDMIVADAAQLLVGKGWLPSLLRVPEASQVAMTDNADIALQIAAE